MQRNHVRLLWRLLALCVFVVASEAFPMDYPVEFVQNPGGNLALSGLPGYSSTPARRGMPGFGLSYARLGNVGIQAAGVAGEICLGCNVTKGDVPGRMSERVAFSSSYLEMDSLYRRVYTEMDVSVSGTWFVAGAGYGFSAEWVPGREHWGRHRYKSGVALFWNVLSFSAMLSGWTDDPWRELDYSLGTGIDVNGRFAGFVEWDGRSFDVGSSLRFGFLEIRSSYRFPDFGMALSLSFGLGGVFAEGTYGVKSSNWDWFGFSISKQIRKKTIL